MELVFDGNTWNHLIVCKQIILTFLEIKLSKNYSFKIMDLYHLTVCKQMVNC